MKGSCPLSAWNDIFGKPGQGAHSHKLLNVVLVDNLLTILGAVLLTHTWDIPFPLSIIGIYMCAILIHMLFGVQTRTLTYLGIKC